MKKKYFFVIGAIVIATLLIIGIGLFKKDNNVKEDMKTIRVAEVTHSIFYTPFYVAIENGYFKEVGINIELLLVNGSDNVAASVISRDTEVGLAGPESAMFVYNGGEKDYLKVFAGLTKRDGQFIISRKELFDWNDLRGKEILVGRSTGMPAMSFFKALDNLGIKKEEVSINTSIEFGELAGAFIGGEGDYVNLFEPIATKLEKEGKGYVVSSVGLESSEFPYTAFYAKNSYIENNKDILTKFSYAIKKGMDYTLKNDSELVAKSIFNQFKDTNIDDLVNIIERYKNADVWLNTPYINKDFYNTLNDLLKTNKLINKDIPYNKIINNLYE